MPNHDLYVLQGGIGKNICFTSCIDTLGKINIMSPWSKVFKNHPNVNFSYNYEISPIKDNTSFLNKFNNVYLIEPYDSYFLINLFVLLVVVAHTLTLSMVVCQEQPQMFL